MPAETSRIWHSDSTAVYVREDKEIVLRKGFDGTPGSEAGLTSMSNCGNVVLQFDANLANDAHFVAKIHQLEARNQLSNSYHLICSRGYGYLARQNRIFSRFIVPVNTWATFSINYSDGWISLLRNGIEVAKVFDPYLPIGYCFLGTKGGLARIRNISMKLPERPLTLSRNLAFRQNYLRHKRSPKVSIITTVFDRVDCLANCIRSVHHQGLSDYEHLIVADCPGEQVLDQIARLVEGYGATSERLVFASLDQRQNDWGMSPAKAGVDLSRGEYISFLSDDNGYLPRHFKRLVDALDNDSSIGFAYSSCLFDGKLILDSPVPGPSLIDLGQSLFRRALFEDHLGGGWPFKEFAWDWRMIEQFLLKGVGWKHINDPTFIFRLAKYPHLVPIAPNT